MDGKSLRPRLRVPEAAPPERLVIAGRCDPDEWQPARRQKISLVRVIGIALAIQLWVLAILGLILAPNQSSRAEAPPHLELQMEVSTQVLSIADLFSIPPKSNSSSVLRQAQSVSPTPSLDDLAPVTPVPKVSQVPVFDSNTSAITGISWKSPEASAWKPQTAASLRGPHTLGGLSIASPKDAPLIGVVLDSSYSMRDHIDDIRKHLRQVLPGAECIETDQCGLEIGTESSVVIEAARQLIEEHEVDVLYWISDLQDARSQSGLSALRYYLFARSGKPPVRLFVTSYDERADRELMDLVMRTRGSVECLADRK